MMEHQLLPKRIALPIFTSDIFSSVTYAPDEILLTLAPAGSLTAMQSLWVGVFATLVLTVVVMPYRQTVHVYLSGGGNYEVATKNLGRNWGPFVTSALLVDYIPTVVISISPGAARITTVFPAPHGRRFIIAVSLVILLAFVNLRGMKDTGGTFAIPTYTYTRSTLLMILVDLVELFTGTLGQAPIAQYELTATPDHAKGLTGLGGVFLLIRASSSGCAALTGVEAISSGVPMFRHPKSRNAAITPMISSAIAVVMMLSILLLTRATGMKIVENLAFQLVLNGAAVNVKTHIQSVIDQLAVAVPGNGSVPFFLITIAMGFILILAANTTFSGFPTLASVFPRDSFLPRQLYERGDRLSYSNGIPAPALVAIILVIVFEAETTKLVELYVVGVFTSFTLSRFSMIRHWNRQLCTRQSGSERGQVLRSQAVNITSLMMMSLVLLTVLMTEFTHGMWITLITIALTFPVQLGIRRHYDTVRKQLHVEDRSEKRTLPTRVRASALVSSLSRVSMRATAATHSSHPSVLELVSVVADEEEEQRIREDWEQPVIPLPLTLLSSPHRDLTYVALQYIRGLCYQSPKEMLVVYMPRVLMHHWWENAIYNQTQERLQHALLTVPGIILTIVPWKLGEDDGVRGRQLVDDPSKTGKKPTCTSDEGA